MEARFAAEIEALQRKMAILEAKSAHPPEQGMTPDQGELIFQWARQEADRRCRTWLEVVQQHTSELVNQRFAELSQDFRSQSLAGLEKMQALVLECIASGPPPAIHAVSAFPDTTHAMDIASLPVVSTGNPQEQAMGQANTALGQATTALRQANTALGPATMMGNVGPYMGSVAARNEAQSEGRSQAVQQGVFPVPASEPSPAHAHLTAPKFMSQFGQLPEGFAWQHQGDARLHHADSPGTSKPVPP